ncbi:hypothetical protein GCM10010177_46290 [Actinomadura citrea]|nr:hypothetical protein GCM10010177_46290 [Actinomadura citrea]
MIERIRRVDHLVDRALGPRAFRPPREGGAKVVSDRRVGYLEELEHELDTRGLVARVVRTRSGPAFLRVVNPEAASLAEDVTCAPAPETKDHYFWWSWGERMHRVDDVGGAALKLAHVLQPLAAR